MGDLEDIAEGVPDECPPIAVWVSSGSSRLVAPAMHVGPGPTVEQCEFVLCRSAGQPWGHESHSLKWVSNRSGDLMPISRAPKVVGAVAAIHRNAVQDTAHMPGTGGRGPERVSCPAARRSTDRERHCWRTAKALGLNGKSGSWITTSLSASTRTRWVPVVATRVLSSIQAMSSTYPR